ncbi:MAG: methionine--tRNA ligase subunit beta [Phycisphaerales bacterium]
MHEQTTTAEFKPEVSFEDFAKVDLRVARVMAADDHPSADRLLRLQVDDGSGIPRQICAGIKGHYEPAELVGRHILIVANLAPRTIRGEQSRGMLLAASSAPKGEGDRQVVLATLMADLAPGSIVS